ncbi:MAG: hypothetical protein JWN40_5019 [Phycisphaerales bacterium]|nr:hypothetical protein [Phycisphaerales bacterium]
MSTKAAPPSVYYEDFSLRPRAGFEGKPPVAFSRPVNLLSAASASDGAQAPAQTASAHVLVLNLDGQLYIRDLTGSASLQWNGTTVVEASLHHGDRVRLGKIEYDVFATRLAPAGANGQMATPSAELLPAAGGDPRTVRGPVMLVGACEQAELRLMTAGAPEACAMIMRLGAGYWLWNLDPASPCRINGEPVVRAPLPDGSLLTIGDDKFRFRLIPQASAPEAPVAKTAVPAKPAPAKPAPPPPAQQKKVIPVVAKAIAPVPAKSGASAAPILPSAPIQAPQPAVASSPTPIPPAAPIPPPAVTPAPASAQTAIQATPPVPPQPKRLTSDSALNDDADVFKQWGPLAFAVAAADRPELQAGGSRSGKNTAAATNATPAPRGRFIVKLLIAVVVLAVLAAGAFVAWKYGKRYLNP